MSNHITSGLPNSLSSWSRLKKEIEKCVGVDRDFSVLNEMILNRFRTVPEGPGISTRTNMSVEINCDLHKLIHNIPFSVSQWNGFHNTIVSCDNTFHNFLFISKRMVKCDIYDCYITLQGCSYTFQRDSGRIG